MLEAIIFDIDGTLAETEEVHRHAFNAAFKESGLDWHWSQGDYKRLLKTTGGKERIRAHMDESGSKPHAGGGAGADGRTDQFIAKLHARKTELYTTSIKSGAVDLRPGVAKLIEEARAGGLRLAIATTTSMPNVVVLLAATLGPGGLEMFEVISAGDAVLAKKPAPDIFLKALADLDLGADKCVAIEDSTNGLRSAMGAKIPTVITPSIYTKDDDFTGAALVTNTLAALADNAGGAILPSIAALVDGSGGARA